MSIHTIPLFPLNTVLFPGGLLPLRIFEPRYLDMVGECMRNDSGFGVCLISAGQEVGNAAEIHKVGTMAYIVDFEPSDNGLLGIMTQGQQRFQVLKTWVQPNQLLIGEVESLPNEEPVTMPEACRSLADMLETFIRRIGGHYEQLPADYDDASWVSQRLTELLPISLLERQQLLESDDPLARLSHVQATLKRLEVATKNE